MSKWRRPATKTYDYNFKLGEHYYKPQLDYLDTRKGRAKTPPTAKTFAERIAEDPVYGRYGGANLRKFGGGDGLGDNEGLGGSGMARFASLDDVNMGSKRSFLSDLESGALSPSSPRLIVGDRLLDSVGVEESKLSQTLALNSATSAMSSMSSRYQKQSEDTNQSSSLASRRKVGFTQSALADSVNDDPFKSRTSSKMEAARKQADLMMDEMKQDSDSTVSRFRARAKARKEEQSSRREQQVRELGFSDDDDETAALRFRVNEIGQRAKARLAQLEDDFPEIQIGSSLAARRAATNTSSGFSDEVDDSRMASKTLKITKRTVKASYEV